MKATATTDFKATIGPWSFSCAEGDEVEADKKTIGQLEAIGLVTRKPKRAKPGRKAVNDD